MNVQPSYIELFKDGTLEKKSKIAQKHFHQCCLCPHECSANRTVETGFCKASDKAVVSSFGPHFGEESVLVGCNGSGTIFFGYCNMRCVFCQNWDLSFHGEGVLISNEELADMMIQLQTKFHCHNINFVSPTHFVPNILAALLIAVEKGLNLPLVYNCGGYEKVDILRLLDGVVDIYRPDFKYIHDEPGRKLSNVKEYSTHVKQSLIEMDRQKGGLKVDDQGIAYRGLIIRHLMMPGGLVETKEILTFISKNLSRDCLVNIMDQYYPAHEAYKYETLNQRVTHKDWEEAVAFADKLGLNTVH